MGDGIVTILGDSRVFDTYFTNPSYSERYGYDATFPHLLRKSALLNTETKYDVVHIPEHFRGGTVENNIIRLALTDPAVVVLCDGIWETLVHKDWFIEWAVGQIRAHPTHSTEPLDLSYSSQRLAELFVANKLTVSPQRYALKQRRIISYFRRRRRQCVWMSLPMPPREHLNRLHYAGNYRCIPEWDECLKAVNDAMAPIVSAYGATWLDLHDLVRKHGGFGNALLDQWHFSASFHSAIADELARVLPSLVQQSRIPADHASRKFLLSRDPGDEPLALYGSDAAVARWRTENPQARAETVSLANAANLSTRCVLALEPAALTPASEADLLAKLPRSSIILYPDELKALVNPVGADRAMHEKLQ
jgi:hypothetical protein